jgi:hypothetical protein
VKAAETDVEKAEMLVNFFSEVFTVDTSDDRSTTDFITVDPHVLCNIPEITVEVIEKLLTNLDTSKSPGADGLHPYL